LGLLSQGKRAGMEDALIRTVSVGIPAFFLLLFTLIGTVGINLIDVEQLKRELALRVACGASKKSIMNMIIVQNAVITGLSSIPGIIIILFSFPFNTSLPVVGFTLVLTMLLSLLCALYPALKIFSMKPAELLKEE
ncbi:MAG: ABC transporter permease, partial [Paraprevotella sp.]|nr:ABC transporter permease [Paraprevotella sp.]